MSLLVFNGALLKAQVTIGDNTPPNATLDVVASNPANASAAEGVIAPRLTGDQIKDKDGAYGTLQNGAIVYATAGVTGTPTGKTVKIVAEGYYYYDAPSSMWQRLGAKGLNITPEQTGSYTVAATDDVVLLNWTTSGNRLTIPGTTESVPVGKILYISNRGTSDGAINTITNGGSTVISLRVSGYATIGRSSDYAFLYLGNNLWISITSY